MQHTDNTCTRDELRKKLRAKIQGARQAQCTTNAPIKRVVIPPVVETLLQSFDADTKQRVRDMLLKGSVDPERIMKELLKTQQLPLSVPTSADVREALPPPGDCAYSLQGTSTAPTGDAPCLPIQEGLPPVTDTTNRAAPGGTGGKARLPLRRATDGG